MAEVLNEVARQITTDGMPQGNVTQLPIQRDQVTIDPSGVKAPTFDDTAAATIVWNDFAKAKAFLDENSWLMEWQYIDYLYQSPNYDRDVRSGGMKPARISRFNVAKNSNTMSAQTRRAIFTDEQWFVLEPRGKLAGDPDAETILSAWTELFTVLSARAELDYNMRLFIECFSLQGTAIGIPIWEEKPVEIVTRKPKTSPKTVDMPTGQQVQIHTLQSDDWEVKTDTQLQSFPAFEFRRLGTTLFDEKWRHPGRPDLSGFPRIDVDYVTFQDLQQMRQLDCYKDIPDDENLCQFFLNRPYGNAAPGTDTDQNMSANSTILMHARGENVQTSYNPFTKPLLKLSYWTETFVIEVLEYEGRRKVIRNGSHQLGTHAAGYTANWYNIPNSGYGYGIGRLNAGDQRMSQGVLNEILKMIAFPLNAPILYDNSSGNAPTQNVIAGLGTFLGVDTGQSKDIRKAIGFMEMPQPPEWAWRIFQLAMQGGEDLVGANQATMQGQLGGPGSSFGRTATGASRLSQKADENIADPVDAIENVLERWLLFLQKMVREVMPIAEIRGILSEKFGAAILQQIQGETFFDARFEIKVLAGKKLAAKAAIMQLIPFLEQLLQQPQALQFMHQKGWTINFLAIEKLYMRMSELVGREDIIVPLSDQEKQMVQQMQPGVQKIMADTQKEQLRGQNELAKEKLRGENQVQTAIVDHALDRAMGATPLELAEARTTRNNDMAMLRGEA